MKNNWFRRTLCCVLALVLVLGYVPVTALAEGEDIPAEETLLAETTPSSEPDTIPETVPETEPETVPETIPDTEPVTEPVTEPETVPETTAETEPGLILAAAEAELEMEAAASTVIESGSCGDNLTWTLTNDGALTISGTGDMDDYAGNHLAPWYAYRSQIDSVTIDEGVTSISGHAFYGCASLTEVTIPAGVTSIWYYAFSGCSSLTKVTIPDGVTSIKSFTFSNCFNLTSVTIPDSVTSIERDAFTGCASLTKVTYAGTMQQWQDMGYRTPAECSDGTIWGWGNCGSQGDNLTWTLINGLLTISGTGEMREYFHSSAPWCDYRNLIYSVSVQEGVTSIGEYAFYDCTSLTSVAISEGVTSIGQYAFNNCTSLTSVIIPVSVTAINLNTFTGCTGLSMMTYNGTAEQWMAMNFKFPAACADGTVLDWGSCNRDLSYILDGNGVLAITGSGTIISYSRPENVPWYAYRAQIKEVTLPDGITRVGTNVFYDCVNLESISIPDGVETIGQSAFYRCSSLKSIRFPSTLETIGGDSFAECTSLTQVRIPASVTSIGEAAFCHCTSLTEITFDHVYSSQLSIGRGAFSPYDDGSYGPPASPINLATTVYVPARLDINPAIRNYPWAGTSDCSRDVTYVTMNPGVSVATGGDYRNEVAVDQTIPMIAEVDGVADPTVTWSVVNGTGTAAIDQNGYLTGRTTGTVTVYATAANGLEGSCTVNVLRYVEDITILLNGKQNIRRLGIGQTLQLSALLTPEDTTTSGVTWSVEDGTGSASIRTYGRYSELTGVSAGTVTLIATANDSKQVSATLELTVTDTIDSYAVTGGNLYYNTETGVITGSDSTVTDVIIPALINGVTITGIAPYAFASRNSGGYVNENTTLKSVSIPNTVTEIGDYAFYSCTNLSTLRFAPGSSLTTIGIEAFCGCSSLVNLTIPDTVKTVGDRAFWLNWGSGSQLKYLTLSGELDTRGWLDYRGEILESVTFTGSKIISQPRHVENNGHYIDAMPGRIAKKVIISDSVKTIEAHAFCSRSILTEVSIGDGVTAIEDYAFYRCDNLTQVTMGDSVQTIGDRAFSSCSKLTQVTMGDSVQAIGDYAFVSCSELTQVIMGDSVQTIGDYAFSGCDNLTTINLPDSLETIGTGCFSGCEKLHLIDLSALPAVITEKKTLLTGKADIPAVLVRATGGKVELSWNMRTIEGEPEVWEIADWYRDQSGQYWLETHGSGRFLLYAYDEYTGAQGSKVVEVKAGTVIRPTETDYLVSGGKLQLSIWQMPAEEKLDARWTITAGQDYATLSATGLLTAKDVTQARQVTVTATPLNGGEAAAKTIWILPKTTGIRLKQGESNLGETLDVDMHAGRILTLSAHTYPEDALDAVSWSSGNPKVATVDQNTGEVTLIAPGTVVITATTTDGSKVSASVTLKVIYLDAAKTLTASADVPAIGLQPGQTATVTVSGGNAIDPEELDFATSNPSIATVDSQGMVTAGNQSGTATITAMLKGDPLNRKVSLQIPVIAMQVEKLKLEVEVNGEMLSKLELPSAGNDRSYPLFPTAKDYRSGWYNTTNVRWESSDTAVAKVTIVKDGNAALVIPKNANGECVITATANDLNKVQAQLTVSVRDYSPRLGSNKIILNSYSQQGVALDLRESYGNAIASAELTGAPEGFLLDSDTLTLYAEGVKNGTFNLTLNVTCEDGKTYPYHLQAKVANTLPAVTVKQTEKFNLFYLDSTANLTVTASGQIIDRVELADTNDFTVSYADGTATLHYAEEPAAKPDTKGTLLVYLKGYNTPVSKAITISTTSVGPKLALSPASSTINTVLNDSRSVDLKIWNQTEGGWLTPDKVDYTAEFATIAYSGDTLTLTLDGDTGGTATIWVRQSNWAQAVKLTHKVTVSSKLPVIKLGSTKLTLNSYFTERSAATPVTLSQGNLTLNDVTLVSNAKAGTAAAVEAEKLNVHYSHDDGCIHAEIPDDAPKAGTYTYSVKGILSDGQTELSGGTLKVTVSAAMPKVKLSASSVKLNKYLAGQETGTLTVSVPAGYTLEGFEGMDETLGVEGNVLTVRLTGNEAIGKRALSLHSILKDEATDQIVTLPTALKLTVQVYESSKLGVSLSAKGKLDTLNPDSAIVYTPKLTNCIGTIDGISLTGQDADKFHAELEDGKIVLTLRDGEAYATNVTYKVQFQISTCGKEILSPVMNVKITQSKVKLTAAPAALILYQSQGTPLTLRLTQSMGEIDDISISTKTSSELLKALGEDGINATIEGDTAGLKLTVENAALLKAGKSYALYLDITPKNNAANLKPAQMKLAVKVMK